MHLEIEINKEIMEYKAQVVSGLTLRQFVSLVVGIILAAVLYFTVGRFVPNMVMIWIYAIVLLPCAIMGFASYNGLEGLAMIKMFLNYMICPKKLSFTSHNLYYDVMQLDEKLFAEENRGKAVDGEPLKTETTREKNKRKGGKKK